MNWYQFKVFIEDGKKEILNAFLINLDVDAILDNGDHFLVYKENPEDLESLKEQIADLPGAINEVSYQQCENKNWNAEWEANYDPIAVEDICYIRAEFHEPNRQYPHEIIIRPEMAFGTGHHETTYMMLQLMDELNMENLSVLDYGCGTGILSVFAMQKKAAKLLGIDIEQPAVENSYIHQKINKLESADMKFLTGGIELAKDHYDLVLANINRRVLLETCEDIYKLMKPKATLLMSGILEADEALIMNAYSDKFNLKKKLNRGEWICFHWEPKT